jgi:hypothetical protein
MVDFEIRGFEVQKSGTKIMALPGFLSDCEVRMSEPKML